MRLVISNVFDDHNRGCTALTTAAISTARTAFSDAEITLIAATYNEEDFAFRYRHTRSRHPGVEILPALVAVPPGLLGGLRALLWSGWTLLSRAAALGRPGARRILEADALLCRGGHHTFRDRKGLRGVMTTWLTAFPLILAIRFGVPVVVLPSTIGPLETRSSRLLCGWILRKARLVLVRDLLSHEEALGLGVSRGRVMYVPDGVLAAPPPDPERVRSVAERVGLGGVRFLAVTVRGVGVDEVDDRFLAALEGLVRELLERRVIDRVAVVVQSRDNRDDYYSEVLVRRLSDHRVRLVSDDLAPEELMALYGAAAVTIGTRLHSAIFALVAGTPTFGVSLDDVKTEGVFEALGLREFVLPFPDFDLTRAAAAVAAAVADGESLRMRLRETMTRARADASMASMLLRATMNGAALPDMDGEGRVVVRASFDGRS